MNKRKSPTLIKLSYIFGLLIGLYLVVIAAWADMEAAFYGFSRLADAGLRGFSCPVLMASDETRMISLKVSNPTNDVLKPVVRVEVSTSFMTEEYQENLELAPRESTRLEWSIGPENIDLEHFIFAKALVFSTYPIPNRQATCGTFVMDLPVSGSVVLPILVLLSLLGMGSGLYEMNRQMASNFWVEKHVRPMTFLVIVVILGIVVSFMGGWIPSILLLAVALLMIFILAGSFIMSERRK